MSLPAPLPANDPSKQGVYELESGTGVFLSGPRGKVKITNTGVTSLRPGQGVSLNNATGDVVITALNRGTVEQINTGCGLNGGPITRGGTISLANSGVQPGVYSLANISVDSTGRIIAAANGNALTQIRGSLPVRVSDEQSPVISVDLGSETFPGILRVSNSTCSLSSTTAASSLAVKTAYDVALAAISNNLIHKKGDILVGVAEKLPTALPVGKEGQVLSVCAETAQGLAWKSLPVGITEEVQVGDKTLIIENGIITGVR